VGVTSSAPGGVGSISVTAVDIRDCSNGDLPGTGGTPGAVPIDNQAPSVTVGSPNGGENWVIGSMQKISWTASDNGAVSSVDIAISSDGGATYPNVLATGIANSGTFTWTVAYLSGQTPGTPVTNALLRVTAHDAGCASGSDGATRPHDPRPIINASAGTGGTISPSGSVP
jgi:hypothetical protein